LSRKAGSCGLLFSKEKDKGQQKQEEYALPPHLTLLWLNSRDLPGSVVTISGSSSEWFFDIFNEREEYVSSYMAETVQQHCVFLSLLNRMPYLEVFWYCSFCEVHRCRISQRVYRK